MSTKTPCPLQIDTQCLPHIETPWRYQIDTPCLPHIETPWRYHIDTPSLLQIETPCLLQIETPWEGKIRLTGISFSHRFLVSLGFLDFPVYSMLIGQRRREAAGGGGMADADWLDCTVYTAAALPRASKQQADAFELKQAKQANPSSLFLAISLIKI